MTSFYNLYIKIKRLPLKVIKPVVTNLSCKELVTPLVKKFFYQIMCLQLCSHLSANKLYPKPTELDLLRFTSVFYSRLCFGLLFSSPNKIQYLLFIFSVCATHQVHPILADLITLITSGEDYKLWRICSLYAMQSSYANSCVQLMFSETVSVSGNRGCYSKSCGHTLYLYSRYTMEIHVLYLVWGNDKQWAVKWPVTTRLKIRCILQYAKCIQSKG